MNMSRARGLIRSMWRNWRANHRLAPREYMGLGLALCVFSIISLGNITRWSVWFDEGFSVYLARHDFVQIASLTAHDVHPPLYYWILKVWMAIAGASELAVRSLSLVCLLASIVIMYFFVRRWFSVRAAQWSVALLACSPMLIRYSEEARMYALEVLILTAMTALIARLHARSTRRGWIFYGVLAGLACITHYLVVVSWVAHFVWRYLEKPGRQFWSREWTTALFAAAAMSIWWLPFMIKQILIIQNTGFWIVPVSISSCINYLTNLLLYREYTETTNYLALLVMVLVALATYVVTRTYRTMGHEERRYYRLVLLMALLPVALLFITSLPPLRSSFVERYLLTSVAWWAVMIGVAVAQLIGRSTRERNLALGLASLMTIAQLIGVAYVYQIGNYNKNNNSVAESRSIMQAVWARAESDQPIIASDCWLYYPIVYYDTAKHPVYFRSQDEITIGAYEPLRINQSRKITNLAAFGHTHARVWLVTSFDEQVPGWKRVRTVELDNSKTSLRAYELEFIK